MNNGETRILLIYPPSEAQTHGNCPAGLMMLGAVLESAGYCVRLLDANARSNKKSMNEVVRSAAEFKPHITGITLVTPLIRQAYTLVPELKKTGTKLLAGGPHATILPEEVLEHGFDAVLTGEGEYTIVAAVAALLGHRQMNEVSGFGYRDEGGTYIQTAPNPVLADLDLLPLPARHLTDPNDYAPSENLALMFSSRGCPARCAYCSGSLFGKKFRFRSAQNVLDEIAYINKTYGYTHFHFVDDAMTMDKGRIKDICAGLKQLTTPITWSMMTRIDAVDEELLLLAAESGCRSIDYGVESGDPGTLKKIHKPHTIEMVKNTVRLTKGSGINPNVFFILGFPWEGCKELEMTKRLMVELTPYVETFHPAVASILIPFPGTEIYESYKDEYDLEGWWLTDDRNYGIPKIGTHSYYETKLFAVGAVLEADFFYYSPDMKAKIIEIFTFMFMHNLKQKSLLPRLINIVLFNTSKGLDSLSPKLERLTFETLMKLRKIIG